MGLKIALVGRPNVGKSALFNRICQKRISIVEAKEGVTRDRLYARAEIFGKECTLIDTGGIDASGKDIFVKQIGAQARLAIEEADGIIFLVDGKVGLHPLDSEVAKILLPTQKPVVLAVNKIDSLEEIQKIHDFHSLAIPHIFPISAMQGHFVAELLEKILSFFEEKPPLEIKPEEGKTPLAIVGRANVGKSTLLNRLLGEERSIVSPEPGTTRDSIDVSFSYKERGYVLVDTAGIRRKKAEKEAVDKFAAIRTEEAIDRAEVCLLILDSYEGLTTQEKRIAHSIEEKGKSCILLFNKWDLVKNVRMEHALKGIREEIPFLNHCPALFLSALKKRNLDAIFPLVEKVCLERKKRIATGELNRFIEGCLQRYHPPLITGKRLRIYYMTQVEQNPPKFVVFVNRPHLMTESYRKYLVNQFRKTFGFIGCPLKLELRAKPKVHAEKG